MKRAIWVTVMLVGCADVQPSALPPKHETVKATRKVAITIDDLPLADFGRYPNAETRSDCVARFASLIKTRHLPTTGFFNMSIDERDKTLLPLWREAGMQLGNHTWSHPALSKVGLDAYLADLEQGHRAVEAVAPQNARIPFRYPFLNEGFVPADRDRIRHKLTQLKSVTAPVTIDTSDWLYARGYLDAIKAGDAVTRDRFHQGWMWNLQESTQIAEFLARELFGREPPQILLVHGNVLNADHFGEYVDWLTARGYRFVSLDEALADPAYHEEDHSTSPTGDSHWLRLMRSRTMRPAK